MSARRAAHAPAPPERAVGRVLVVSRLPLVAQAVTAALRGRGVDVAAVGWGGRRPAWGDLRVIDADEHDLLLVLAELQGADEVDEVVALASATRARCLVITTHPPDRVWGALLAGGVAAVLPGESTLERVEEAISRAGSGADMMGPELRAQALHEHLEWADEQAELEARFARLSPRERHVLELLAEGHRVRDVSVIVGRTEGTVRSQIKSVRHKLGVHSQLAAVVVAHRMGLGQPPR